MKEKTFFLLVILSSLIVVPKVRSANDASRIATIESLIDFHTFSIDSSHFINTIDKVKINGKFYSEKPPFPSLIGAIVYFPISQIGFKLDSDTSVAYYLICLFSVKLIWLISIFCFYKILELIKFTGNKIFPTSFLAFGSLFFTWSTTFNNHIFSASFLIIAFYFWLKSRKENFSKLKSVFFSGLFFLFSGISDLPTLIFFPLFLLLLVVKSKNLKTVLTFLLPLLVTIFPYSLFNYLISGSVKPFQSQVEFFMYENSYWLDKGFLSGTNRNDFIFAAKHLLELLISEKGFLIYNPILFLSVVSSFFLRKRFSEIQDERKIILFGIGVILLFYSFFTKDIGGWSYSVRWFVCLLPFLILLSFPYFEKVTKMKKIVLVILFSLGMIISLVGVINPWSKDYYSEVPFIANLKNITHYFSTN